MGNLRMAVAHGSYGGIWNGRHAKFGLQQKRGPLHNNLAHVQLTSAIIESATPRTTGVGTHRGVCAISQGRVS
jgi:hypothetical protein